ncbi:MAG TPA: lysophospholipid acyltransferase family protein [Vicinamibacterales bacterium]
MSETLLIDRDVLVTAITTFLSGQDRRTLDVIRRALERAIDEAGPDSLLHLSERMAHTGADWTYYPSDPLARRIHHLLADRILDPGSALIGAEHLAAIEGKPVVVLANHLSYSDANLLEAILHRASGVALSDRLVAIAGPKVYSSVKRRFSALCFGTIKTPQSSALSSETAVMNPREVARAARRAIDVAHDRLAAGDALLVFAEGTRSRSNGLQPLLAGVTRYLDFPQVSILPVGIAGTEALFPIGDDTVHAVRIVTRIGRPFSAGALRARAGDDRRMMMDVAGLSIAELLPPEYRGVYTDSAPDLAGARRAKQTLFD